MPTKSHARYRTVWSAIVLLVVPAVLRGESCYSDLGIVRDVKPEHLAGQARAVIGRLAEWGTPLDRWELDILQRAIAAPRDAVSIGTIQQVLDAHVLISLSLSREGEIKAVPGPARAYLPIGGRGVFLVKLDNLGQHISRLTIDSDHAIPPGTSGDVDHWLQFQLWPDPPQLTGERVDYLLLTAESGQQGQREALFVFSQTDLLNGRQEIAAASSQLDVRKYLHAVGCLLDAIDTAAALEQVRTRGADERVVPLAPEQRHRAAERRGIQSIGIGTARQMRRFDADERVRALTGQAHIRQYLVGIACLFDPVGTRAPIERIVVEATGERIVVEATGERIVVVATFERVAALPAAHKVASRVARERVLAQAAA